MGIAKCIVCDTDQTISKYNDQADHTFYDCKRCGRFTSKYEQLWELANQEKSMLSHWIRKQQINIERQLDRTLNNPDISNFVKERKQDKSSYPDIFDIKISLQEKMDKIILEIGELSECFGDKIKVTDELQKKIAAISGCSILSGEYTKIIWSLNEIGMINDPNKGGYSLTKEGFLKYEQLQNQIINSKKVFMAMQFKEDRNNSSYEAKKHLKEILEEFKLELFSMEYNNKLGNIIEVMKAEINDAKFIICDLSDGNKGAYWEAGYAEGQKKKVIYICDEKVFNDEELHSQNKERKIHFDIKQTRIIKFDFSSDEKIKIFKKEIESSIKENGLNI
jgi:nucleoside 2-deoxyribosyltransferase